MLTFIQLVTYLANRGTVWVMTALSLPAIRAIASRFAPYLAMTVDRMSPAELAQLTPERAASDLAHALANFPGPLITIVCAAHGSPRIEEVRQWGFLRLALRFTEICNATVKEHGSDAILSTIFQEIAPYSLKASGDRAVISLEVLRHTSREMGRGRRARPGEIVSGSTISVPEKSK